LGAGLRLLPWGTFVVLLASRTGALADRWGERSLVVAGLALQTIGTAWIALIAAPRLSYAPQVVPLSLAGIGFALAIPAVTKAVVSTSTPTDIGKASGAYSTMRQLGGAFGVAITAAVFAATGGYTSAAAFSDGFGAAMAVAAGLGVAATLAGTLLPPPQRPALRAPTGAPAEADWMDIS
jgi:MFS family permease